MKHLIYFISVVTLLLTGANVRAQQAQTSSGVYVTYVGGQLYGTDTYTLTTNADGSVEAQAEVSFNNATFKAVTRAVQNKPVSFTRESPGAPQLVVEFANGTVKMKSQGQPVAEVKGQPTVLLENGAWHQFLFLFAQYDPAHKGSQSFNAFVPSAGVPFTLDLERIDAPSFKVGAQQVATEHFRAGTSLGLDFEMWTDADHVPVVILIPAQNIRVIRKGSEALAEAITAKPASSANDPFTSDEVSFQNGTQKLVGTLTVPKKSGAPFPGVVIISGSGMQDRDGASLLSLYRLIAEKLSANGVAVLRVDDRGVGKSVPLASAATSYRDLINDSKAAFEFMCNRPQIDRKKVGLAGHSEGALTALMIAAEDPRVAAVMVLAGGSRSLDRLLVEQTLNGLALKSPVNPSDQSRYPLIVTQLNKLFHDVRTQPKPADPATDKFAYFRQHLEIDPLAVARRVHVPTLILNGERDENVLPYHALELAQAMADSSNKQVLVRIFVNLTHVFTPSTRDNSVTSAQAREVSPEFLDLLQSWAANVLVLGKDGGSVPEK
ncbi:MAG TPA: alpha/beta fold hydrolase [Pyrinomonadaceae bacterium]|nr:alpha/beta fold hydrolase [Pyrinomonadaceae bacterium]